MRAIPTSANLSIAKGGTLGSLVKSRNSLGQNQIASDPASILGIPVRKMGVDKIKIGGNDIELSDELYEALFSKEYTGISVRNDTDVLMFNKIIIDRGYTGIGDVS